MRDETFDEHQDRGIDGGWLFPHNGHSEPLRHWSGRTLVIEDDEEPQQDEVVL